ncbi:hypothetical protein ACQEV9_26000 [Streptomyces chartreusis]|uniref:hypothetical protein n=1 Tax=Streptomyces chartreusis TaxID=1969 RepID=UPI003D91532E
MVAQQQRQESDQARDSQRRRAAIAAFLGGFFAALAFFAFFPGLPHVIDWGAILASLAVGALTQWGCRSWMKRTTTKKPEHM